MVYSEIKKIKGKKYYYRVISIRKGDKITKKRIYLGANLEEEELIIKEKEANKKILYDKLKFSLKNITPKIVRILKKYKIKRAGLFGSYSRAEENKKSDIDIIIEPPKNMGIEFIKLNYDLENVLNKKVDLITYNSVDPKIRKYILNDEVRII